MPFLAAHAQPNQFPNGSMLQLSIADQNKPQLTEPTEWISMINDRRIGLTGKWNFSLFYRGADHENWEPATPRTVSYTSRLMDVLRCSDASVESRSYHPLIVIVGNHNHYHAALASGSPVHTAMYKYMRYIHKSCKMIFSSPLLLGCYQHITPPFWTALLIRNCNQLNNRLRAP